MSPLVAVAILALAVALGGLAAFTGERGRAAMPALRTFAIVAAAAIALVHLLPEAIGTGGWVTLLATAAGALVPTFLERIGQGHHGHGHGHGHGLEGAADEHAGHAHAQAPAVALAMGYAAVVVHQAGEGAALASLARTGALSVGIVLAIAAHTVPLAMVVALRVLEVRRAKGHGGKRATGAALVGIAGAMALGALAGSLFETSQLTQIQPWVLAAAAGLLLHALAHDAFERGGTKSRARDAIAGSLGLIVAVVGLEPDAWAGGAPTYLRAAGLAAILLGVAVKVALAR